MAILLAAGVARRLGELTRERPKCLLEVGGRSLIRHQLDAMRSAGIGSFVIVTGFERDRLEAHVAAPDVTFVHNEVFDRTNSLYSLNLAREHGRGGFLLANADVLFHPRLLARLLAEPAPDALLLEPTAELGDEEMKVRLEGRCVRALAKTLPPGSYHGENLGLLKFSAAGAAALLGAASRLIDSGEHNAWAPKALDAICAEHPVVAVETDGLPWIEIDFPQDLERARQDVWPRIVAAAPAATERRSGAARS